MKIEITNISATRVFIGFEGEQNHLQIAFDCGNVFAEYPDAYGQMAIKPPTGNIYPKVLTRDGNSLIWDVSASDCSVIGNGEYQITFTQGETVVKSFVGFYTVRESLVANGEAPEPVDDWLTQVELALAAFDALSASAETLPAGSAATATVEMVNGHKNVNFGIPTGATGATGAQGTPGVDGVSPTVDVEPITGGHEVTITDKDGAHTFDVMNGEKGEQGDPGTPGDPTELIDDSSTTATNKVWSAKKSADTVSTLNNEIDAKQDAPASGAAAGKVLGLTESNNELVPSWVNQPSVPVQDVQVNGTSILSQGVANVPVASGNALGVAKISNGTYGVTISDDGELKLSVASDGYVKSGENANRPLVPYRQHLATFYGLAKAAGADMASLSSVTVGQYPEAQKVAIQKMLGIYQAPWELIREDTFTNATEADHIITVDGNGQPFELTDIRFVFWLPQQSTPSSKGSYGTISFLGGVNKTDTCYIGAWTQAADAASRGAFCSIEQRDGMVIKTYSANQAVSGNANIQTSAYFANEAKEYGMFFIPNEPRIYTKVTIKTVLGTGAYRLYGKRKWWT